MQECNTASWLIVCHDKLFRSFWVSILGSGKGYRLSSDLSSPDALLAVFRASMVPGLTNSNAKLAAENTRLNDGMAKLVKDLTEENRHLLDENQRLNKAVQKVLVRL